eukprot:scaffold204049_cov32-Tisochrysis_lutea.AAC.1
MSEPSSSATEVASRTLRRVFHTCSPRIFSCSSSAGAATSFSSCAASPSSWGGPWGDTVLHSGRPLSPAVCTRRCALQLSRNAVMPSFSPISGRIRERAEGRARMAFFPSPNEAHRAAGSLPLSLGPFLPVATPLRTRPPLPPPVSGGNFLHVRVEQ